MAVPNGGSLSNNLCYFEIIEAFMTQLPKLLVSTVCCIYSNKSDTNKFIQILLSEQGFCFQKTLKEPPFVAVPILHFSPILHCPCFTLILLCVKLLVEELKNQRQGCVHLPGITLDMLNITLHIGHITLHL